VNSLRLRLSSGPTPARPYRRRKGCSKSRESDGKNFQQRSRRFPAGTVWNRGGSEPRLFWQRRTFLGTRTNECGYLEWTAAPQPVVGAILGYVRAPGLTGPQYGPVLDALRSNGLDAAIVTTGGGCHLIRVYLADGPDVHLMAKHVARYVTEAGLRHDGHRRPTAAAPEGEVTARSLSRLIGELAQLPCHQEELDNPGGALITVTERDGSNTRTTEVPAELVSRMHAVLFSMLTVMRPYDE
jgi:hypothetical protein